MPYYLLSALYAVFQYSNPPKTGKVGTKKNRHTCPPYKTLAGGKAQR